MPHVVPEAGLWIHRREHASTCMAFTVAHLALLRLVPASSGCRSSNGQCWNHSRSSTAVASLPEGFGEVVPEEVHVVRLQCAVVAVEL